MDCTVHGVAKSRTRLGDFHFDPALQEPGKDGSLVCCSPWVCKELDTT